MTSTLRATRGIGQGERFFTGVLLALALATCTPPMEPTPTLDGTWVGRITDPAQVWPLVLRLTQAGNQIEGSATASAWDEAWLFNVSGNYDHPAVTLQLTGPSDWKITGTRVGERLTATLGDGYAPVTLERRP